jgi:hypothetical protein
VKVLMRGFGLALLMAACFGLSGCGADNENEADKLQKTVGAAPATDIKGDEAPPPVSSQEEYGKRAQANDPYAKMKKKK